MKTPQALDPLQLNLVMKISWGSQCICVVNGIFSNTILHYSHHRDPQTKSLKWRERISKFQDKAWIRVEKRENRESESRKRSRNEETISTTHWRCSNSPLSFKTTDVGVEREEHWVVKSQANDVCFQTKRLNALLFCLIRTMNENQRHYVKRTAGAGPFNLSILRPIMFYLTSSQTS